MYNTISDSQKKMTTVTLRKEATSSAKKPRNNKDPYLKGDMGLQGPRKVNAEKKINFPDALPNTSWKEVVTGKTES